MARTNAVSSQYSKQAESGSKKLIESGTRSCKMVEARALDAIVIKTYRILEKPQSPRTANATERTTLERLRRGILSGFIYNLAFTESAHATRPTACTALARQRDTPTPLKSHCWHHGWHTVYTIL